MPHRPGVLHKRNHSEASEGGDARRLERLISNPAAALARPLIDHVGFVFLGRNGNPGSSPRTEP